jgi:hypothetical protein
MSPGVSITEHDHVCMLLHLRWRITQLANTVFTEEQVYDNKPSNLPPCAVAQRPRALWEHLNSDVAPNCIAAVTGATSG